MVGVSIQKNEFENSYKYFIGILEDNCHDISPLNDIFSQTIAFMKRYDNETKCMYFLLVSSSQNITLTSGYKVCSSIKKELDSEALYNSNYS